MNIDYNEADYAAFVGRLKKTGQAILDQLTPEKADLDHMAKGVAGEAGELLDAVKRHTVYGKDIDRDNVIEELGDLEFFLEGLGQNLGIDRDETIATNMRKLSHRYASQQYSDAEAINRADKQ